MERRCSPRFEVHVPVMVDSIDESGAERKSGGFRAGHFGERRIRLI